MTTIFFGSYKRVSIAFVTIALGTVLSAGENLCSKVCWIKPISPGSAVEELADFYDFPDLPDVLPRKPPNSVGNPGGKPMTPEPVVLLGVISTVTSFLVPLIGSGVLAIFG